MQQAESHADVKRCAHGQLARAERECNGACNGADIGGYRRAICVTMTNHEGIDDERSQT
jgi:hypothetical protein